MKYFSLEEKKQILKWYFRGNSLSEIINLFGKTYDRVIRSISSIRQSTTQFEKHGCLHFKCNYCAGNVCKQDDEAELQEIMICAASELELSIRDIAIELEISKSTVFRILKKNGYSKTEPVQNIDEFCDGEETFIPLGNVGIVEKCSEEERQIIEWYCRGSTPAEIVELFMANYKSSKMSKVEIYYIIQLFQKYGCIRKCKKCVGNICRSSQINEENILDEIITFGEVEPKTNMANVNITQITESSTSNTKQERHTSTLFAPENNNNMNMEPLSSAQAIEFVSVEPTIGIIVVDERLPKRKRKKY